MKNYSTRKEGADMLRIIAHQLESKDDGQLCSISMSITYRTPEEVEKMIAREAKKVEKQAAIYRVHPVGQEPKISEWRA